MKNCLWELNFGKQPTNLLLKKNISNANLFLPISTTACPRLLQTDTKTAVWYFSDKLHMHQTKEFYSCNRRGFICHHFPPFSLLRCKEQVLLSLSHASDYCRNSRSNYGLCSSFPVASTLPTLLGWLLLSRADLTLRQTPQDRNVRKAAKDMTRMSLSTAPFRRKRWLALLF